MTPRSISVLDKLDKLSCPQLKICCAIKLTCIVYYKPTSAWIAIRTVIFPVYYFVSY